MARVIEEAQRQFADPEAPESKLGEYLRLKSTKDDAEKKMKTLYDEVMEYVDSEGYEDDKGNRVLDLDAPIGGFLRVERVMRSSRPLDLEAAEAIIEAKGLHADVYEMVEVLSEQKIMQALQADKLTAEEVDLMYPVKTTYAFTPKKK